MTRLDELFDIRYGHGLSLNKLRIVEAPDGVNYVSRGLTRNGVAARVEAPPGLALGHAGELTVALNGQGGALATFVQPSDFVTGYHVAILAPRRYMTVQEKLWWARCIWANHYRYGFGRQANRTLQALELPDSVPTWAAKRVVPDVAELSKSEGPIVSLSSVDDWGTFTLDQLFEIRKGRRLTKREQGVGSTPYIGSSALRNGVTNRIDKTPAFPGHVLTVPYNGSVGHAFYQPEPFCAGDDVHVLVPLQEVDQFALLFVAGVIRLEKFRYSYGRKWHLGRMQKSVIKLPQKPGGAPDWDYMSAYIRGLKFSSAVVSK